ncbi:cation-translocating P-type ATPase [Streptomyces sp. NPDC047928]|uniref:cation-translocating P-type ATPase n=1 Tax=unclassified Streptomyces TaxID=2593676 RepID=UPI00371CC3C1
MAPPRKAAATPPRPRAAHHHGLATHEVVLLLETDPHHGLTAGDAASRLERFGPNALPAGRGGGTLRRVLRQFHHPLIHILMAAGAITAALGSYVDSAVILGVVAVNALVGFLQESKAESALDGLRSLARTSARVMRDGRERTVPSEDLVPGDLVRVEAGDAVPADVRLLRLAGLRVDESALTGESVPVVKDEVVLDPRTPVADRHNMIHSGTLVTAGHGVGVVVATGPETELGEVHRLVGAAATLATPLTAKLARFSRTLTVIILALAAVTFAMGVVRGQDAVETFTAAVALAVGAIPEGLPAAVTITLAIGVVRMARRGALIRRLPAVETLGSTTVICSDKTGTLTENRMTVRAVWTPDGTVDVTGSGYAADGVLRDPHGGGVVTARDSEALRWCLVAGVCCNDAVVPDGGDLDGEAPDGDAGGAQAGDTPGGGAPGPVVTGDPTEVALLVSARKAGLRPEELRTRYVRVGTVPFSSERRWMATLHRDTVPSAPGAVGTDGTDGTDGAAVGADGTPGADGAVGAGPETAVLLVKGAAERVADLCAAEMAADGSTRPLDRAALLRAADELAATGLRVLATAVRRGADPAAFDEEEPPDELVLTGLQAMLDPPRAAAASAIDACHTAGITVKMITGDHAATARNVAGRLGLLTVSAAPGDDGDGDEVLTGAELAALPSDAYPDAVERARVFARVSPEQKLRLVEALQERGHVVAMTGDGVNDAPALRQADIGVAMGGAGTEVAKDASDMVLTDDDFATIEAAVEEGRGVFDNLTKFIVWTLPTNMGEGLVILVAVLMGATLPILPTQILWINMTTAVALGLMLAFEPKETGIMSRPPRDPGRPLLTPDLGMRVLLVSALLVAGAWWVFTWERGLGADVAEARTAAVNLFVAVEAFYLFSCRSLTAPVSRIGLFTNRWVVGGVLVQASAQLVLTYVPAMNRLFHTAPIGPQTWLRVLGVALLTSLVVAIDKRLRRRTGDTPRLVPGV